MKNMFWTIAALASHWRKHPANLATLVIGITISTALWSGVQALNAQARHSYAQAAAIFTSGKNQNLVATRGGFFSQDFFVKFRKAGVKVSPIIEGTIRVNDKELHLIGIEPLTLPKGAMLSPSPDKTKVSSEILMYRGRAFVSPETLKSLSAKEGFRITTERNFLLPPLSEMNEAPPGAIIADIGVVQKALERQQQLTRLVSAEPIDSNSPHIAALMGDTLRIIEPDDVGDLTRLTDSFHLNLTAFGFLAFIVGFFIVHASYGLTFEQRLPMVRTLRALGASNLIIMTSMLFELAVITLLGGTAGIVCGYLIAAGLLPNVAASLEGLYGAQISGQLTLDAKWLLSGIAMASGGALLSGAAGLYRTLQLPVISLARPIAWRDAHYQYLKRQSLLAIMCLASALFVYFYGDDLKSGFIFIASFLLGIVLLLPLILVLLVKIGGSLSRSPLAFWFFADSRQEIPGLSLALMALLLALSSNIGVGGMVTGFRQTFLDWLDERLVAELYFETASRTAASEIEEWARHQPNISAILPVWRTKTRIQGWPIEIMGMRKHETYSNHFPLLQAHDAVWNELQETDAILISEQLSHRLKLGVGAFLELPTPNKNWRVKIVGVFSDYGNPKGQIRIDHERLIKHFSDTSGTHYSLRVAPDSIKAIIEQLHQTFGAKIIRVVDQAEVKTISKEIFERTFTITTALNTLTLIVSAVALFSSLITLSNLRLTQIAPVWAIGITISALARLELIRILLFSACVAIMAIPLGLFLSWGLVTIINVLAFGWRLPMHFFPLQWMIVFLIALLTGLFAAIAPVMRLSKSTPASLLKAFSNER